MNNQWIFFYTHEVCSIGSLSFAVTAQVISSFILLIVDTCSDPCRRGHDRCHGVSLVQRRRGHRVLWLLHGWLQSAAEGMFSIRLVQRTRDRGVVVLHGHLQNRIQWETFLVETTVSRSNPKILRSRFADLHFISIIACLRTSCVQYDYWHILLTTDTYYYFTQFKAPIKDIVRSRITVLQLISSKTCAQR